MLAKDQLYLPLRMFGAKEYFMSRLWGPLMVTCNALWTLNALASPWPQFQSNWDAYINRHRRFNPESNTGTYFRSNSTNTWLYSVYSDDQIAPTSEFGLQAGASTSGLSAPYTWTGKTAPSF